METSFTVMDLMLTWYLTGFFALLLDQIHWQGYATKNDFLTMFIVAVAGPILIPFVLYLMIRYRKQRAASSDLNLELHTRLANAARTYDINDSH